MEAETLPTPPEDLAAFRVAQLLVVMSGINTSVPIERLGYYDFFVSNPILIESLADADRTALVMAGFDSRTIDHQSAAQRFANRRQRLRSDVASLVAYGLCEPHVEDGAILFGLTGHGVSAAASLTSAYADGLRVALSIALPPLRRLSDRALRQQATAWLRLERFDLDLLGIDELLIEKLSQ